MRNHAHGRGRGRPVKLWRHPLVPGIQVTYRVASTIAVMQMGVVDYSTIAQAVGLGIPEIQEIDGAADGSVRELAVAGIPGGEYFRLLRPVRCPKCQALVSLAPCVGCESCAELPGEPASAERTAVE